MNNYIRDKDIILEELLNLLAGRYPIGLYEYLYSCQPGMYKRMRELEDEVDNAFLHKNTKDLKKVLREYWTLHMEAIRKFKNQDILNFSVNEVKQQIQQELHFV